MNEQWWGWILSSIGLIGFWLAGKKIWWAWYVNIANQLVWLLYAVLTAQIGFLVGVAFYTVIFARNAVKWTQERNLKKRNAQRPKSIGLIDEIHEDEHGVHINWTARPKNSETLGMELPLAPLDDLPVFKKVERYTFCRVDGCGETVLEKNFERHLREKHSEEPLRVSGRYPWSGELREHVTRTSFGDAHVVTLHRHDFKLIGTFLGRPGEANAYKWYYKWECRCGEAVRVKVNDFWKEDQNETT